MKITCARQPIQFPYRIHFAPTFCHTESQKFFKEKDSNGLVSYEAKISLFID
jgi:hypothetical protein